MLRFVNISGKSDDFRRYLKTHFSLRQQSIILAFFVGLLAGVLGFAFKFLIETLHSGIHHFTGTINNWWEWTYLPIIGFIGACIAGYCVQVVPQAAGSGIPEVRLALHRAGKEIQRRNIIFKFFGGIAGIGTGLSMGREGPTVQIGASCGTLISKLFNLKGKRQKNLVASGAGAGLAAAFNTPIAGVLFVVEELSHNFSSKFLAPCIIASVTASVVIRHLSGNKLSYSVPLIIDNFSIIQLPVYIIVGLLAGILGVVFINGIMKSLDFFATITTIPKWLQVGLAGLITGIVALKIPEVTGDGHTGVEMLLNGEVLLYIIPIWFILKLLLTSLAYGSGAPGGLFAPSLLCGASIGLFVGEIANHIAPGVIDPRVVALVGMASFFTAVVRTPITAAVIIFEMTGNYHSILPIMFSCILADLVSSRLFPRAIYPALLFRSTGIDLDSELVHSPLEKFTVGEFMTHSVDTLIRTTTIAEAFETLERSHHNGFPVLSDKGKICGIVTLADLENAFIRKTPMDTPIEQIMTRQIIYVYPSDKIDLALERLHDNNIGRVLVVDPSDKSKLLGILTRSDILKAEIHSV